MQTVEKPRGTGGSVHASAISSRNHGPLTTHFSVFLHGRQNPWILRCVVLPLTTYLCYFPLTSKEILQQKLLLQNALHALDDAGYVPDSTRSFQRSSFGCYVGVATGDYVDNLREDIDVHYSTGKLSGPLPFPRGEGTKANNCRDSSGIP